MTSELASTRIGLANATILPANSVVLQSSNSVEQKPSPRTWLYAVVCGCMRHDRRVAPCCAALASFALSLRRSTSNIDDLHVDKDGGVSDGGGSDASLDMGSGRDVAALPGPAPLPNGSRLPSYVHGTSTTCER